MSKKRYIYLVNNLKTTVFDSQFLGWIKMYETDGVNFDIVFIPRGIKSYFRDFKYSQKKSIQISKTIKGRIFHTLPSSIGSFAVFISLFLVLFTDIVLRRKIIIQVSSPAWHRSIKWLRVVYSNIYIIYDAIGASAEKYLLSKKDESYKQKVYAHTLKLQLSQAKLADKIVVVSNKLKEYLLTKDNAIDAEKIDVVSCSADDNAFYYDKELREKTRSSLNINDKMVFIYCGALNKDWQIPDFIFDVFSRIRQNYTNSFFICLTPNHEIVEKYIKKCNIDPASVITKFVKNHEINQYLCAADMGFLFRKNVPTNNVAAPTKFSEYTLAGLPAIISKHIGDFSEFVEEHQIGIVIEDDMNVIEDQIKSIDIDSYDRNHIADLGRKNFSKQVYFDRAIRIYKEIE